MSGFGKAFGEFASTVARWTGRPPVFVACCLLVAVWALSGPVFGFSDTWQLIINTSTTIVTFLMVFLIQNTQNRDNEAVQAKLDELIRSSAAANDLIGVEHLSDAELKNILAELEKNATRLRHEARTRKSGSPRRAASKAATGRSGASPRARGGKAVV